MIFFLKSNPTYSLVRSIIASAKLLGFRRLFCFLFRQRPYRPDGPAEASGELNNALVSCARLGKN
jgi:hypothetical protein